MLGKARKYTSKACISGYLDYIRFVPDELDGSGSFFPTFIRMDWEKGKNADERSGVYCLVQEKDPDKTVHLHRLGNWSSNHTFFAHDDDHASLKLGIHDTLSYGEAVLEAKIVLDNSTNKLIFKFTLVSWCFRTGHYIEKVINLSPTDVRLPEKSFHNFIPDISIWTSTYLVPYFKTTGAICSANSLADFKKNLDKGIAEDKAIAQVKTDEKQSETKKKDEKTASITSVLASSTSPAFYMPPPSSTGVSSEGYKRPQVDNNRLVAPPASTSKCCGCF